MPVPPPKQSSSTLGQIRDEVVGELKQTVKDTGKAIASEPKKILESILGKTGDENPGVEDMSGGSDPAARAQAMKQQQLIAQKQAEDQQKSQKLLSLHRQRLQEEEAYFHQSQQKQEAEEKVEEQKEEEEKKKQIFQLQHEKAKEDVLGSVIKQYEGSKEKKAWGAG